MSLNITANIRCLDPQFAGGPDAQSVASYTQQTRHAVTVEERVPIYDGRAAAGFRLFDVTAPESEQAEARRQQQRCGYTLARKVWTVPEQAIVQIQNPSKARDDGSADRDGEVPGAKQARQRVRQHGQAADVLRGGFLFVPFHRVRARVVLQAKWVPHQKGGQGG